MKEVGCSAFRVIDFSCEIRQFRPFSNSSSMSSSDIKDEEGFVKIKRAKMDPEITAAKDDKKGGDGGSGGADMSFEEVDGESGAGSAIIPGEGDDGAGSPEDISKQKSPPVNPQMLPEIKYEYLDHTADVQIHAWGENLSEAFEQCAMAMFAYMTDIERVDNHGSEEIEAQGHDMISLLYKFLDEFLFIFNADPNFIARKVSITSFDRENFKIRAIGYGETFDIAKHPQGTEVKAITYSNMQFHEKEDYAEVFVIIDI